ncbi:MAG: substrate-binding domain-containing protein, partial [Rhodospirillales bacterium]|nr:substrate-binding domain-containing protein [Rhodospirillales bacterium]
SHATNVNSDQRSVLFLRRSISLQRGRRVLEHLHELLQLGGCRVVEVSYTDGRDAIRILRNMPRFDACVLQNTFEPISIDMLSAARQKTEALVVDGAVLAGTEIDAAGNEWGSAVDLALDYLQAKGHRAIGYVQTSHFLLATELGRIRFLARTVRSESEEPGILIEIPAWPQEDYEQLTAKRIGELKTPSGRLPFTALIVWGIENGAGFVSSLSECGVEVPSDLSIILIGRTDLDNEHAGFFTICGTDTGTQAKALHDAITERWQDRSGEYRVRYLPMQFFEGRSVRKLGDPAS